MKKAELEQEYNKLKEKLNKQYNRQNEYNKEVYDRFSLMLPKGLKAVIKDKAAANGESINGFILKAINDRLNELE